MDDTTLKPMKLTTLECKSKGSIEELGEWFYSWATVVSRVTDDEKPMTRTRPLPVLVVF